MENIIEAWDIFISRERYRIVRPRGGFMLIGQDAFAREYGFTDWHHLLNWLEHHHGLPFSGLLLEMSIQETGDTAIKTSIGSLVMAVRQSPSNFPFFPILWSNRQATSAQGG